MSEANTARQHNPVSDEARYEKLLTRGSSLEAQRGGGTTPSSPSLQATAAPRSSSVEEVLATRSERDRKRVSSKTRQVLCQSAVLASLFVVGCVCALIFAKSLTSNRTAEGIVYGATFTVALLIAYWHCSTKRHAERIFKSVFGICACVPLIVIWIGCQHEDCLTNLFHEPIDDDSNSCSGEEIKDQDLILYLLMAFLGGYAASFLKVGVQACCPRLCSFHKTTVVSIQDATRLLKTGDIILTSDKNLPSKIIKLFTLSRSSHAVMVIRDVPPQLLRAYRVSTYDPHDAFALEATPGGVRLMRLSEWLEDARTSDFYDLIVTRQLCCAKSPIGDYLNQEALLDLMESACRKPFEQSPCRLVQSILGMNVDNCEQYFCSELVGSAYRELGVFKEDAIAANIAPDAFLSPDLDFLPWLDESLFHLGPTLRINIDA